MLADHNQVTTIKPGSLKKRLSNDFTAMHNFNDENCEPNEHMCYVTSPKKQKFLPPAPRQKKGQVAEEAKDEEEASECLDCPLCLEVMDSTDLDFHPCAQCHYQMCLWCHGRVMENDAKCPGCRAPYTSSESQPKTDAAEARDTEDSSESNGLAMALSNFGDLNANAQSFTPSKPARHAGKNALSDSCEMSLFDLTQTEVPAGMMGRIRVIQRNLMYVTNMPPAMADQRKASSQHFGEFGTVARLVIRTIPASKPHQSPVVSAYVTYVEEASTALAISQLNGNFVDGKRLRASFGSNKYCNAFIRNEPCTNPRCSYLHQLSGTHECFWEKNNNPLATTGKKHSQKQKPEHKPNQEHKSNNGVMVCH